MNNVCVALLKQRELAGFRRVKDTLNFLVSEFPRWSYAKHRSVYYRDERAHVSDADLQALSELCEARKQYRGLIERIERLEAALRLQDEDFHRFTLDALSRQRSAQNRTVD